MKKKFVLLVITVISLLTLCSCSNKNEERDVELENSGTYLYNPTTTADALTVYMFNDYQLTDSNIKQNEDGSYTVTLEIDKPIK